MTVVVTSGHDSRARRIACEAYVTSFDSHAATVGQQQRYAECVDLLHPTEPIPKGFVAVILACCIIGAAVSWRSERSIAMAVIGFLIGGMGAFLAALVGAAFVYVLS